MKQEITSLKRVLTTLGHEEPDRVPFMIFATFHAAKEMGIPLKEYFSKSEYVVEGQLRIGELLKHDCLSSFFYASIEIEAFGGETIFIEDGPPNSSEPIIKSPQDIKKLQVPKVSDLPCLQKVINTITALKEKTQDQTLIIGVVMSPFSLPVMQLGFDHYFDLMYENEKMFEHLMHINELFCVEWANAQLSAGAHAICYFDPISSSTIITPAQYRATGFEIAKRTMQQIQGPVASHFASGRCLPILDDVAQSGCVMVGVSSEENLSELKGKSNKRVSLLGNLNGVTMRRWNRDEVELEVKNAIANAAQGGGFILSDNHGEIPYQVPKEVLLGISDAVQKWGKYPLDWVEEWKIAGM